MNMLKPRIITGVLYIAFIFGLIFLLPETGFAIAMGFISCFMLFEWMKMAGIDESHYRMLWLLPFVALLCMSAWWKPAQIFFILFALVFWFLALVFLIMRQLYQVPLKLLSGVEMIIAYLVLVPMFAALMHLRALPEGPLWILMLFVMLWSSDTFAYVAGNLFGRHKLAPKISPGKTWEGLLGGIVLTVVALYLYEYFVMGIKELSLKGLIIFPVLVIVATIGDLFESHIKRTHNVKDSGNILPGHGGLLDRLDSLTAAAPIFACLLAGGVL